MYIASQEIDSDTSSACVTEPEVEWDIPRLRKELIQRGIWTANIPGNVECWYSQILTCIQEKRFTFETFADAFARTKSFDFGITLKLLTERKPPFAGGWLNGELS